MYLKNASVRNRGIYSKHLRAYIRVLSLDEIVVDLVIIRIAEKSFEKITIHSCDHCVEFEVLMVDRHIEPLINFIGFFSFLFIGIELYIIIVTVMQLQIQTCERRIKWLIPSEFIFSILCFREIYPKIILLIIFKRNIC